MALAGIIEGILGNAAWNSLTAGWRQVSGQAIKITSPAPREPLRPTGPLNNGILAYEVRGRLKRLPANHTIWLLCEHEMDGRVWPQGFRPAKHYADTGAWQGWINGTNRSRAKILAVVAPPTSHAFFSYWQTYGGKTGFAPLNGLPPECNNKDEVTADLLP